MNDVEDLRMIRQSLARIETHVGLRQEDVGPPLYKRIESMEKYFDDRVVFDTWLDQVERDQDQMRAQIQNVRNNLDAIQKKHHEDQVTLKQLHEKVRHVVDYPSFLEIINLLGEYRKLELAIVERANELIE